VRASCAATSRPRPPVAEVALLVAACAVSFGCSAGLPLRPGALAVAALAAALAIAGLDLIPLALVSVAPWSAGRLLRSRRELVAALAERNRQLEAEREALAALAVRRERTRIAQELHDIVAHHLAVMVIQAGAGRVAAPDGGARLAGIREAGHEALAELEHLVALLRTDEDEARPRRLDALLGQSRAAGVQVAYEPLPEGVRLAPVIEDGAYRVIQEALTNAMKHAAGSSVRVRLGVRAHELAIDVCDDGPVVPSPLAGSGLKLGLAGMRERVESLGGRLDAGPLPDGGWRLEARLPLG
jgi:signal transduction histidine kinase